MIHGLRTIDDDGTVVGEAEIDRATAKRHLNVAGFGLFNTREIVAGVMRSRGIGLKEALLRYGLPDAGYVLAVPNKSTKIAAHLVGSDRQHGAWKDPLRQCPVPGVMITNADINKVTIGGTQQRCTLIVLDRYHMAPER